MKHRIKATIETEKTGLFGNKKKVLEEKWIEVDEKMYQQLLREGKIRDDGPITAREKNRNGIKDIGNCRSNHNGDGKMAYSELIKECKLSGKILAVTRVHSEEEVLTDTFGCIYRVLPRVLAGETFTFALGSCSCSGFDHNTGLRDDMPSTPGGFGLFLSRGSDQRWTPPGEKFKCDPQTAEGMWDHLPKAVMGGFDALRFEPYREGLHPDIVVAFCNPDQLSALIVLHGYDKSEYDRVIATTVSGCASMVRIPLHELTQEKPRAVITGTDLAARKFVAEEDLAFAVTGSEFEKMLAVTGECFFHSPVWKPVRNRLRREEHLEDARFTGLA